jgi:hypothetical protein
MMSNQKTQLTHSSIRAEGLCERSEGFELLKRFRSNLRSRSSWVVG